MTAPDGPTDPVDLAAAVAGRAMDLGVTLAAAESLTSGQISCHLGAAPSSSTWYRGTVVAYSPAVKQRVLGVPPGPVVTEGCARTMAVGAARLLDADLAVAVTGVGGPEPEEGQPAGTVWFAVTAPGDQLSTELRRFPGDPEAVLAATVRRALELLLAAMTGPQDGGS